MSGFFQPIHFVLSPPSSTDLGAALQARCLPPTFDFWKFKITSDWPVYNCSFTYKITALLSTPHGTICSLLCKTSFLYKSKLKFPPTQAFPLLFPMTNQFRLLLSRLLRVYSMTDLS